MMNRKVVKVLALSGMALSLVAMTGCPKPPPPPPPPVAAPPPPPPPVEIQLDQLAQELKADPRVQFASGMMVTEDQKDLGTAIVHLADAFAKGDDKALGGLITRKAQVVLNELKSTGAWEESTKGIEAVRVVFFGTGVDLSGTTKTASSDPNAAFKAALEALPEAQRAEVQPIFDALPKDTAVAEALQAQLPAVIETLKGSGVSEDAIAEMQKQLAALVPQQSTGSATGVLLAIQDPHGAYLIGWGVELVDGKWIFANAPSSPQVRARASAFDGVGQDGFRQMMLETAITDAPRVPAAPGGTPSGGGESRPGGDGGGGESTPAPAEPPAPTPIRKNTPGGPINVPGGG